MRFRLIDAAKKDFPVQRLCGVLDVSPSGYFAWQDRPACRRQRDDMVLRAHVGSAFAVSNGTYGSPRSILSARFGSRDRPRNIETALHFLEARPSLSFIGKAIDTVSGSGANRS